MPYYNNPYQQNQYMYQQPQYQQSPIIWVQGLESAKAYPVQPGASVLLMDSDANVFYIKSADNSGMPNLRIFDYAERIAIDGATIPASTMVVTPAAVEQFWNVSRAINADVWRGCCQTVTVRNTSDQPILVQNANIIFSRPDLYLSN